MNKSGLIDAVSKTTSLAKRDAEDAVNVLVHVVSKEVRSGRRVVVAGFGSFNPTHRGARMGRNPRTGAAVSISASRGRALCGQRDAQGHSQRQGGSSGTEGVHGAGEEVVQGDGEAAGGERPARVAAKTAPRKATTKTTKRVATKATKNSTRKAVKSTAGRASKKVVGRAPVRKTTRVPRRGKQQRNRPERPPDELRRGKQ